MAERRRAPRLMMTGQVSLSNEHQHLSGQLVNASQSGMGLYVPGAAQPGSLWQVSLALGDREGHPAGQLEISAILVRQIHTGEGLYWGLALSGLSWEQRQRWERLLEIEQARA